MERLIGLMLLSTVLALAHGYCYRAKLHRISQFGPRNMCMDENDYKIFKLGSKWQNSQCETCVCTNIGMTCCETIIKCAECSTGLSEKCKERWGKCH